MHKVWAVSYTHLDVYKRQMLGLFLINNVEHIVFDNNTDFKICVYKCE